MSHPSKRSSRQHATPPCQNQTTHSISRSQTTLTKRRRTRMCALVLPYVRLRDPHPSPREAAMLVARLANHRNPHIGMLALALLETLVQSCGYPFHLQIGTKEFLNELVRRFPERPPPFPGPVMQRILDLIHSWKEGICATSRWKEDLGNIRDMHRLLTFKGYRFREMPRASQNLASASNIKSADELEAEDREAQEAKLQELIRRGTPRDLAAAQELMKSLAGANPEAKPDYRSQALNELNKLEQKVILMNEMLDNVDRERGEKFVSGDVYDQVAQILVNARPRIQKWISDAETEDPESLDTYLQINDQINTVINRYEAYKKGDYSISAVPAELAGPSQSTSTSLIDFDEPSPAHTSGPSNPVDELAELFGPSSSSTSAPPQQAGLNPNMFSTSSQPPQGGFAAPQQFGSIMLPGTPQMPPQTTGMGMQRVSSPNYFGGSGNGMGTGVQTLGNGMGMGAGMSPRPQQAQQPAQINGSTGSTTQPQQQGKDPFADLAGLF
ncbi:VHS-domain-containing protein [Heliocybe sulcata]|uniref:VHS-domain-containing protein n=1 Tax=Heliocybe sulcata TaxID=5364 RepID=A0A5C3MYY5_9AGAM|nr:VHS-domain-containing protein [Heliocybe sulcata]